jgi:hypothetical protein
MVVVACASGSVMTDSSATPSSLATNQNLVVGSYHVTVLPRAGSREEDDRGQMTSIHYYYPTTGRGKKTSPNSATKFLRRSFNQPASQQ